MPSSGAASPAPGLNPHSSGAHSAVAGVRFCRSTTDAPAASAAVRCIGMEKRVTCLACKAQLHKRGERCRNCGWAAHYDRHAERHERQVIIGVSLVVVSIALAVGFVLAMLYVRPLLTAQAASVPTLKSDAHVRAASATRADFVPTCMRSNGTVAPRRTG